MRKESAIFKEVRNVASSKSLQMSDELETLPVLFTSECVSSVPVSPRRNTFFLCLTIFFRRTNVSAKSSNQSSCPFQHHDHVLFNFLPDDILHGIRKKA